MALEVNSNVVAIGSGLSERLTASQCTKNAAGAKLLARGENRRGELGGAGLLPVLLAGVPKMTDCERGVLHSDAGCTFYPGSLPCVCSVGTANAGQRAETSMEP